MRDESYYQSRGFTQGSYGEESDASFYSLKDRVRSFGSGRRPAVNVHDRILALLVDGAGVQPRKTLRRNILVHL